MNDTMTETIKKRRYFRFDGDPAMTAAIDLENELGDFEPDLAALIFQEGYGGCGLIVYGTEVHFYKGMRCRVRLGSFAPLAAEVAWTKPIDDDVTKVGFKYLEVTP